MPRYKRKFTEDELSVLILPERPVGSQEMEVFRGTGKDSVQLGYFPQAHYSLRTRAGQGERYWASVCQLSHFEIRARMKSELEAAQEILDPENPMTLRHLYYIMVQMRGMEHSKASYGRLSDIVNDARKDGIIEDRCIADPHRTALEWEVYKNLRDYANRFRYSHDRWKLQSSLVELWVEKAAIVGVLSSIASQYQITLRPFKGHASRTLCYEVAEQFSHHLNVIDDRPITVYYCGDLDPSGISIPESAEARIKEIMKENFFCEKGFTVKRIAFLPEDFADHAIEPWDVETRRNDPNYPAFKERYGEKCAELDALPAEELRNRFEAAVRSHIDEYTWEVSGEIEEHNRELLVEAINAAVAKDDLV